MKYNIAFYCQSIPFSSETIRLQTSLGGSETALIYIAKELAARGHNVKAFTLFEDPADAGHYDGVEWHDASELTAIGPSLEHDIFISLRMADILTQPIRAKYRVLWNQDELIEPDEVYGRLWQTDEMYYVSEWQRGHYEEKLPEPARTMGWVTKNGIDLETVDDALNGLGIDRDMNQLIYISRPERGLVPLLKIFPKLRERNKHLTLKVCRYYSMYENNPNVASICANADRLVEQTEGVEYLGNLNKADLYRNIAQSALMVYPGVAGFNETSCIAAIEAQACETPLICSARGGLLETLSEFAGVRIDGDPDTATYQKEFFDAVFHLLENPGLYRQMQAAGRWHVENGYQYKDIASDWEAHFDEYFEARLRDNYQAIYRNLVHHDDFVAAQRLAADFGFGDDARAELESLTGNETPENFALLALKPEHEFSADSRLGDVLMLLEGFEPKRILDFACGNGTMLGHLVQRYPDAHIVGIDFSKELCDIAFEFASGMRDDTNATVKGSDSQRIVVYEGEHTTSSIETRVGSLDAIGDDERFDLIFCGEYLEHCNDYKAIIDALESHLADDGLLVWTVPSGPFLEFMGGRPAAIRSHRIHWEFDDIENVFGAKANYKAYFMKGVLTQRGNQSGHWFIMHGKGETGEIDWEKKIKTTRPYQSIALCMITRDEEVHLRKCLESVYGLVDEIVIGDMMSQDSTLDIAKFYGATVVGLPRKAPDAPEWAPLPGSFEWARNAALEAVDADWILWLDADEELIYPAAVRKYLDSPSYEGFVIRQNHLMLDRENRHDTPIRLFRGTRGYKWYGHIHEHAMESINKPIFPAIELQDVEIAHYGYIIEARRQVKCRNRNMLLLKYDRIDHPNRKLGEVLLAREFLNMIVWDIQDGFAGIDENGRLKSMNGQAQSNAKAIYDIFHQYFTDFDHQHFELMWPIYQKALKWLAIGKPIAICVDNKSPDVEIWRFESKAFLDKYLVWAAGEVMK